MLIRPIAGRKVIYREDSEQAGTKVGTSSARVGAPSLESVPRRKFVLGCVLKVYKDLDSPVLASPRGKRAVLELCKPISFSKLVK